MSNHLSTPDSISYPNYVVVQPASKFCTSLLKKITESTCGQSAYALDNNLDPLICYLLEAAASNSIIIDSSSENFDLLNTIKAYWYLVCNIFTEFYFVS
jgi:hypothetical protein